MVAIVTANAIHGGVETIVEMHGRLLNAPIYVAGGLRDPYQSCPFDYTRADTPAELEQALDLCDVVIYHWLPRWATDTIKRLRVPAIEYVHRTDTSDGDKSVPKMVVAHSQHIVDHLRAGGCKAELIPYPLEVDTYPLAAGGPRVGGVTSYYTIKGIDTIIRARKLLGGHGELLLTFYGSGDDLPRLQMLAAQERVPAQMLGPAKDPAEAWREYRLAISASTVEGGTPLAILEAMACGIPAIVPQLPGCLELKIRALETGVELPLYFFDGTAEDLARVMDQVLHFQLKPEETRAAMLQLFPPGEHIAAIRNIVEGVAK